MTRLSVPIIVLSIGISVLSFALQETLIPKATVLSNTIWSRAQMAAEAETRRIIRRNLWFRSKSSIYNIQAYDEEQGLIEGFNSYEFEPDFSLRTRVVAESARQKGASWDTSNGLIKEYLSDGEIVVEKFREVQMEIPDVPGHYAAEDRPAEELNATELKHWIERMNVEGYDPTRYVVDLHFKFSFPFICTIMALIGLPLAFWNERGGGIALGIGAGMALSFMYLVFLGLSRSFGYSAILPPIISAWLPNVLFTVFGLYLFTHMKQ